MNLRNPLLLAALTLVLAASAQAADVAGKWAWVMPGRNGGSDRTNTLTLKVEGGKVSGNVAAPNRDGKDVETPITDAKLEGDTVSFSVTREWSGNSMTAKYSGKVEADKLTGKIETTRNGESRSRDWEAKRVTEKKAESK